MEIDDVTVILGNWPNTKISNMCNYAHNILLTGSVDRWTY